MASIKFTPQDYTSTLAMLNHEGANGISALLKAGRSEDAMGYVSGLIDTWNNRAAARGIAPWEMMNRPSQISFWEPDKIQSKANSLDPRIKDLADAYLTARAAGAPAANPTASFYLNKDLVEATPSYGVKWKRWYEPGTVVSAYGDKRGGGRGSLETQFVQNDDEYKVPEYSFSFDPSLKLSPKSEAQNTYNSFAKVPVGMGYDPTRVLNTGSTGLNDLDVSQGVGPGMIGDIGRPYETGDPYGFSGADVAGNIGPGSNNLGNATPLGPAPGKYDFASGGLVGPIGDANFGAGLAANQPAPGPFDFSSSYLEANPDVAAAGMNAFEHFARFGAKEGRVIDTAGDRFDASRYLSQNVDVQQAGQDALAHYLRFGAAEGREAPIIGADGTARNISSLGVTPTISAMLAPYLQPQGVAPSVPAPTALTLGPSPSQTATDIPGLYRNILGREGGAEELAYWQGQLAQGNSLSSIEAQFIASPEAQARGVQASDFARTLGAPGLSPLQGPQTAPTIGPTAGQTVTASPGIGDYDFSSAYLGANQDVAQAGMGAWEHFLRFGAKEGRALNAAGDRFDANKYLSQNADVLQAGEDPLMHYVKYGAAEGRAAPLIGVDGTASTIQSLGLTPTISAELTRFLQPQGLAPTIGAPALSPLIGAGPATQAWSQGTVSPFGFGGNVSQGVPNGSFGAGITPQAPISSWGFSGANVGGGLGATAQGLGGDYAVGSAVSNMGMDLPGATGISDYSFGNADVSGFDANQGGGAPAPQEAPSASGYGDGGSIAGRNSQLSQNEYFATQARQQALATANNNLFGQQITGIAPGNQTIYDYATGRATGGPAPQIQQTPFTPVNMGGVFAPLATAAFMPRFSF